MAHSYPRFLPWLLTIILCGEAQAAPSSAETMLAAAGQQASSINARELKRMLEDDPGLRLLDLRTAAGVRPHDSAHGSILIDGPLLTLKRTAAAASLAGAALSTTEALAAAGHGPQFTITAFRSSRRPTWSTSGRYCW